LKTWATNNILVSVCFTAVTDRAWEIEEYCIKWVKPTIVSFHTLIHLSLKTVLQFEILQTPKFESEIEIE
jgi:hypothetical protein